MKKADNFNPGKWLVENKITTQSRLNEEKPTDNMVKDYWNIMVENQPEDVVNILVGLTNGDLPFEKFSLDTANDVYDSFKDESYDNEDEELNESKLNEEEGTDILSFLKSNKQELLDKLATKFKYNEDDMEFMSEYEIGIGADVDGNEDAEIAGLGEAGLDFSFNPKKVKDTGWYGDSSNFKLVIAGKPIYGISYNM
jgi:hypothetical protein